MRAVRFSATVGDPGVATRDGATRYVAVPAGGATAVEQIRTRGGHVVSWATVPGLWGTASVGYGTSTDGQGLSHDGRTLALAHTGVPQGASTTFVVLNTRKMQVRDRIVLKGQFSFDALSPDASRMYVIQFAQDDQLHYVVRAYDMATHRLLPGRIADKAQRGWVMQGVASSRVASPEAAGSTRSTRIRRGTGSSTRSTRSRAWRTASASRSPTRRRSTTCG